MKLVPLFYIFGDRKRSFEQTPYGAVWCIVQYKNKIKSHVRHVINLFTFTWTEFNTFVSMSVNSHALYPTNPYTGLEKPSSIWREVFPCTLALPSSYGRREDGQGCYVGVADRKMTHETKEDEGDQWTRVMRCVRCLYLGRLLWNFLLPKKVRNKTYSQGIQAIILKIEFTNSRVYFVLFHLISFYVCILCCFIRFQDTSSSKCTRQMNQSQTATMAEVSICCNWLKSHIIWGFRDWLQIILSHDNKQ